MARLNARNRQEFYVRFKGPDESTCEFLERLSYDSH